MHSRSSIIRSIALGALLALATTACDGCNASPGTTSSGGRLLFTPDPADFGYVIVDQSKELKVAVKNTGRGTITVRSIDKADGFPEEIRHTPPRMKLEPGEEQFITLFFQPKSEGVREGKLLLRNDGAEDPTELVVRGVGIKTNLVITPNPVDFGKVIIDDSAERTAVLENQGDTPVDVFVDDLQGDLTGAFRVTLPGQEQRQRVMAAGEKIDLTLNFRPSTMGPLSATFSVRPCAGCPPTELPLQGQGIAAGIVTEPEELNFGSVLPNTKSTKSLLFRNVGNKRIGITNIKPSQAGTEFAVVPPSQWPILDPGATTTIDFSYSPINTGNDSTIFVVDTDDVRAPRFELRTLGYGGGPIIDVTPAALEFNTVAMGFPVKRRVVVSNRGVRDDTSTADDLVIAAVEPLLGDFAWSVGAGATLPLRIPPGAREIIEVTYGPTDIGQDSGTLRLLEEKVGRPAGDYEPHDIPLHGTGVAPAPCNYELIPAATPGLQFGVVQRGRTSRLAFRLRNKGTGDCIIGGLDIDAASSPAFTLPAGPIFGRVLAAGAEIVTEVEFAPPGTATSGTSYTGAVVVNMSSTTSPEQRLQLSGRGAEVCLSITPVGVDFGVVEPLCQTNDRTFTVYNACRTPVGIDQITAGQGQAEFNVSPPPRLGSTCARECDCRGNCCASDADCSSGTCDPTSGLCSDEPRYSCSAAQSSPNRPPSGSFMTCRPSPGATSKSCSMELCAQGQLRFNARYRPTNIGPDNGTVEVYSNQAITGTPPQPYVLTMQGRAENNARATETFVQAERAQADILFVIDDSGSMSDKQTALANNFSSFMSFAASQGVDYQIAVTNTGTGSCTNAAGGRFIPASGPARIVTPALPDPIAQFATNARIGANGCADEMGLEAGYLALSDPNINGPNAGFIRPDAYLSVVIVSDEEDHSPQPVDFYVNFFQNIKGPRGANLVSVSAITGIVAGGCRGPTPPGSAQATMTSEFGERYVLVTQRTGGLAADICSQNWAAELQKLGLIAFGYKSRFILNSDPDVTTLRVTIDGIDIPAGPYWSYSSDTNSIDFLPTAVPPAGSTIEISYAVACN